VTPVVVDTNILFSALLSADGRQRGVLLSEGDVSFSAAGSPSSNCSSTNNGWSNCPGSRRETSWKP
jgi:hypothetical protein